MEKSLQVNYNAVAAGYNQRMQGSYLAGVTEALQDLARQVRAQRVLDLGCGTGRSLQGLAASREPAPLCYGLDFSEGMLHQARQFDAGYRLVQASSPQPPFAPAAFDLVFCVHAFHHFPNKPQVIRAAYNILRPGGALAIVNIDPQDEGQDWYVYTYFEGTYQTDLERFPTVGRQEAWLREAGFQRVSSPVVQHIDEDETGEAIFSSYYIRKDSSSQLILLSDEAYDAGLARIQAAIEQAKASGYEIIFRTQLKNKMCYGFKPG